MTTPPPARPLLALVRALLGSPWGEEVAAEFEAEAAARGAGGGWRRLAATLWLLRQVVHPDTLRLAWLVRASRAGCRGALHPAGTPRLDRTPTPEALVQDVRFALRSLFRSRAHAAFAIGTLALGLGAATSVLSAIQSTLLRPLPYEGADRMVALWRPYGAAFLAPDPEQVRVWREQEDIFEQLEWVGVRGLTLTGVGEPTRLTVGLVRPSIHDLVGRHPTRGRTFTDEEVRGEGARVLLVTHGFWRGRLGADPGVVGRTLTLEGEPWTIVGVLPRGAVFPSAFAPQTDAWAPFSEAREELGGSVVGRLRAGVTLEQAQARLDAIAAGAAADGDRQAMWAGKALSLVDSYGANVREALRVLAAAVLLLLALTCVNVTGLLVGRAYRRRHEHAIRAALGAGRRRLVRMQLLESLLLAAFGAAGGFAIALGLLEGVSRLRPDSLDVLDTVRPDGAVVAAVALVAVLVGLATGFLPALQATRPGGLESLRSGSRTDGTGRGRSRGRWVLVATQVAVSFALVVASTIALRTLIQLQRDEVGFDAEGLLAIQASLPRWKYADEVGRASILRRMEDRIASLPGVAGTTRASGVPPTHGITFGAVEVEGLGPIEGTTMFFGTEVDASYFRLLGQPIVAGRGFTREEVAEGAPVRILGEGAARRLFGDADPVGRRMRIESGTWRTIVGVAADVAMTGPMWSDATLQLYGPVAGGASWGVFGIRVREGASEGGVLRRARAVLLEEEPDLLIEDAAPVAALMRASLARERFVTALLAGFSGLALLLAAVGLFGVVSHAVGERTRELGIRLALGATRAQVQRLILGGGALAAGAGVATGVALAFGGLRLLDSQVVGLSDADPASYLLSGVLVLAVTMAACHVPARRAGRVDPVESLRAE